MQASKPSAAEMCQRVNFLRGLQESCEECRVSFPCCGGMDDASPPAKPRPTPSSDRQVFVCLGVESMQINLCRSGRRGGTHGDVSELLAVAEGQRGS